MAIYRLSQQKNNWKNLQAGNSSYSKEYADKACSLYLEDELIKTGFNNYRRYFRMYAKEPHNQEMALAYDVHCPHCKGLMKPVGGMVNNYKLYLYECPKCSK